MPRVPIDFSTVEEFEPLEKGEYNCIIEEITYVEAQVEDKYDYLNLRLSVTDEEYLNRKLWKIWSLSPKALFRMKQDLENLGYDLDELEVDYDEDTLIVTEPDLMGVPCIATVTQRTYEGKIQNQVDVLRSLDSEPRGKTLATGGKKKTESKASTKKASSKKFR